MESSIKNKISVAVSLFTAVILVTFLSCSTDETQTVTNFTNLTMADEFDLPGTPDPTIWGYDIGTGQNGWGNNELQYYTDRSENIIVEDGLLKFTVRQESYEGSGYTSARILTKGKFEQQHGRFEARIKLPWGQGLWPAFWMLGDDNDGTEVWPQIGEIDIMENRGQEPTIVGGAVHGPGYSGGTAISKPYELENDRFDTDFHVFGIEWGEDYINYYVDDVLYNRITPDDVPGEWVYNDSFYIIMNVAVGGSYVGSPNASTVFPQEMLVDYVRVYSAE
ncbi:glycoside hydrolase family 16 protein [Winogradskyella costae]|uniref:glycoside hydrolase family 16 protein n=1 Tax=Winogradskyella costae TaxID=2697008 RepID=UPI0015CE4053|nr:glycoside hydrolase family 16 protein [Winogradskyella costae]